MSITLTLSAETIDNLDLSAAQDLVKTLLSDPAAYAQKVKCFIDYPRSLDDPRELSEIPQIRLWFIQLDAVYPWMLYFLDWRQGELARYAAMLIPHQFNPKEGIQFNPEALEIFVYSKIFILMKWMKEHQIGGVSDLRNLALFFGFEVNDEFLQLWQRP